MKQVFTLALSILLFSALGFAQNPLPSNIYAAGVSYNGSASPEIAGTALYAHLLSPSMGTYGFTVFDALPTSSKPFTINTNVGAGIAQKAFTIGKVGIYVPAAAGFSWQGSNLGWSWSTGALASIKVYDNWRVYPNVRFQKSSVSNGSGVQPILGVLIGWGK